MNRVKGPIGTGAPIDVPIAKARAQINEHEKSGQSLRLVVVIYRSTRAIEVQFGDATSRSQATERETLH